MISFIALYLFFIQGCVMASPFSFSFPPEVENFSVKSPQYITASDTEQLAYYDFVPAEPKAVMVFYHGGGAWSMKLYQYMANQLAEKHKIATYLFDIRGHGNSAGDRGDAPCAEQVWQDVSTALDLVYSNHHECKILLGGHSSGAGLVLNYSAWPEHKAVDAYVLLAPYLGPRSGTAYDHNDVQKNFVKKVRLIPLLIHAVTRGYFFSHSPVIFFNYPEEEKQKDSHLLEYYTCAMSQAVTPNNAEYLFSELDTPFMLFAGKDDEQFIPEKIVAYHDYAKLVKDRSVSQIVPGATHLSIVVRAPELIANI
jgi:acylglycerol lipase